MAKLENVCGRAQQILIHHKLPIKDKKADKVRSSIVAHSSKEVLNCQLSVAVEHSDEEDDIDEIIAETILGLPTWKLRLKDNKTN